MKFGRYINGNSWLHKLDPRTKLVCAITLALLALRVDSPIFLGGFVIALLILPILVKLPLRITGQLQKSLWVLLGIIFCLNAFLTPGQPIQIFSQVFSWFTIEGVTRGSTLALRLNTMVLLFAWLTICTSPTDLSDSLGLLLRPLNKCHIPTQPIILGLAVAFRFVPLIFSEADRIYQAQRARGAHFSGHRRFTRFIPILIPLFVATFMRADRLTQTLESRGFRTDLERSTYYSLSFHHTDLIALIAVSGFTIATLITL